MGRWMAAHWIAVQQRGGQIQKRDESESTPVRKGRFGRDKGHYFCTDSIQFNIESIVGFGGNRKSHRRDFG